MNLYNGLSIGELSERTGVPVLTLRAWERRHGYPRPLRLPSGHRRYDESEVEVIRSVAERRHRGVPLERALDEAGATTTSVASSVAALLPRVATAPLQLSAVLAVSQAIEDAAAASSEQPLVIGSFQHVGAWERSAARWRALAPATLASVALAPGLPRRVEGRLWTGPVDEGFRMAEEWAVICDGPDAAACVVATERPVRDDGRRMFDTVWSTEANVVRLAARLVWGHVQPNLDEAVVAAVEERLASVPALTSRSLRSSTNLCNRVVEYLDARP